MIKNFTWLFSLLTLMSFTKPGDELATISELVSQSERQLTVQQNLKGLMERFQVAREGFVQETDVKKNASEMVELASQILNLIDTHHYYDLFPAPYLEELKVCTAIGGKKKTAP